MFEYIVREGMVPDRCLRYFLEKSDGTAWTLGDNPGELPALPESECELSNGNTKAVCLSCSGGGDDYGGGLMLEATPGMTEVFGLHKASV